MARLFLTLYLGIIATGFVLLVITSGVIEEIELEYDQQGSRAEVSSFVYLFNQLSEHLSDEALAEEVSKAAKLRGHQAVWIAADDPLLSDAIRQQVVTKQVAVTGLEEDGDEAFWFRLENGQFFRIEVDPQNPPIEEPAWIDQLIIWAILAAPAVAVILWLASLQYKLSRLERAALAIADGDLSQRAPSDFSNRVGSLNNSFNRMAEKNEQLIASHKRLTNAVAHELRSPLFRIRCQLDMLNDPEADEAERELYYNGASDDLDELDTLIDEMLQYARMESARLEPDFTDVELHPWLAMLEERFSLQGRHPVQLYGPASDRIAAVDTHLMERAIGNLVRNADRYTRNKIRLILSIDKDNWQLDIEDDGPGIPPADAQRIFKPFERLDSNRGRSSGGHGLGLAIAREIVQLHQGSLELVTDRTGPGACFRLQLPWYQADNG